MPNLSALLERYVVGSPESPVLELVLRADTGIRLVAAAVVARAAADGALPSPLRRTVWRLLCGPRSPTGYWQLVLRLVLDDSAAKSGRLAGWARLQVGHPADWLSEYEKALRHTGREPPGAAAGPLAQALATRTRRFVEELTEAWDPVVQGSGDETVVDGAPAAPLLVLQADGPALWEGTRRTTGAAFRVLSSGRLEGRDEDHRDAPVFAALAPAGPTDHPLSHWTGEAGAGSTADSWTGVRVLRAPIGAALRRAGGFVQAARGPDRPALIVPLGGSDPAARLATQLGLSEVDALPSVLDRWSGSPPTLAFVPWGLVDPAPLVRVAETLGERADIALVVQAHEPELWRPAVRGSCWIEPAGDPGLPPSVLAQGAADDPSSWLRAAMERFGVGEPGGLERFLAIVASDADALGTPAYGGLVLDWIDRGDVQVDARGRVRLRHAGWQAFADGSSGRGVSDQSAPWVAGHRLGGGA